MAEVGATRPMAGRTVLVTGGHRGDRQATALGVAALGARVAITGRDQRRADEAAGATREAGGGHVEVCVGELSSQSQVRRLADQVLERLDGLDVLDVLVNNVVGYWSPRHNTADGLERTFAVNHLAPFLLTGPLLDRLGQSPVARVVTVSSRAHSPTRSARTRDSSAAADSS